MAVLQDLGGADEVWFNQGRRPLHHPVLQHSLPHSSSDSYHVTGPEVLGIVDANILQTGPDGYDRGAEQRHDRRAPGNPRTIHSVAADPENKQIFLPIPAVGGTRTAVRPDALRLVRSRNNRSRYANQLRPAASSSWKRKEIRMTVLSVAHERDRDDQSGLSANAALVSAHASRLQLAATREVSRSAPCCNVP